MVNNFFSREERGRAYKNKWRFYCLLLVMFMGLQTVGCAQQGEELIQWKKFDFPDDGFAISMPAKPEKTDLLSQSKFDEKMDLIGAKQVQYQAYYENPPWYSVGYSVAVSVAPDFLKKGMTEADSFLRARQALISETLGKIIREREILYKGRYPGYEVEFEAPLDHVKFPGFKGVTRIYVAGTMEFYLKVVYKPMRTLSPRISKKNMADFFDSFKILSVNGQQLDSRR